MKTILDQLETVRLSTYDNFAAIKNTDNYV